VPAAFRRVDGIWKYEVENTSKLEPGTRNLEL